MVWKIKILLFKINPLKIIKNLREPVRIAFNWFLDEEKIPIHINDLQIRKTPEKVFDVFITVNVRDYVKLIQRFLPKLTKKYRNKGSFKTIFQTLDIIGNDQDMVISSILNSITDAKKEALIALLIEEFQDDICTLLNKKLSKAPVSDRLFENLSITAIKVECNSY